MALLTKMSQSAAVLRTKQMSLEQPFKLSETITLPLMCWQPVLFTFMKLIYELYVLSFIYII